MSTRVKCKRGHLLDDANTYLNSRGIRCCRICMRASARRRDHRDRVFSVQDSGNVPQPVTPLTEAQQALVADHIGLARWCAAQYRRSMPFMPDRDEMLQDAYVGLTTAARLWDDGRTVAFTTFAVTRMRQAMLEGVRVRTGQRKHYIWQGVTSTDADDVGTPKSTVARSHEDDIADRSEVAMLLALVEQLDDEADRALARGLLNGLAGNALIAAGGLSKPSTYRRVNALRERLHAELYGESA